MTISQALWHWAESLVMGSFCRFVESGSTSLDKKPPAQPLCPTPELSGDHAGPRREAVNQAGSDGEDVCGGRATSAAGQDVELLSNRM